METSKEVPPQTLGCICLQGDKVLTLPILASFAENEVELRTISITKAVIEGPAAGAMAPGIEPADLMIAARQHGLLRISFLSRHASSLPVLFPDSLHQLTSKEVVHGDQ